MPAAGRAALRHRVLPGAALICVLIVAVAGAPAGPAAQESGLPPPPDRPAPDPAEIAPLPIYVHLEERAEARIVLVPVTVVDRKRRPVLGLGVADFDLRVDGRPHPISSFDLPLLTAADLARLGVASPDDKAEPGGSPPAGRPAIARAGAHVAIVVDLFQTLLQRMPTAFSAVRAFISGGLPPRTRVGLFAISGARMLRVHRFTTDAEALLAALDELDQQVELKDHWVGDEAARQDEVQSYIGGARFEDERQMVAPRAEAAVRSHSVEQARRVREFLRALDVLAAAMADLPGRRSVVLVGDGVREQAGLNYARGVMQLADETTSLRDEFRRTVKLFKAGGVTLSPVSLLGLYHPTPNDVDALDSVFGTLQFMARHTGGRRTVALNNFDGEVIAAALSPAAAYVIGFRPDGPGTPGSVHKISVRVHRPGVKVAARTEYVDAGRGFRDAARTAAATLMPERFRQIPVRPLVHLMPTSGPEAEVHVQIALPTRAVAWADAGAGRRTGGVELQGLLRERSGRVVELFRSGYRLEVDATNPPEEIVFQEAHAVEVTRAAEVVVIAIDRVSGHIGSGSVDVPAWQAGGEKVAVSPPLLLPERHGIYFLAADGEPLLGLRLGNRLFLPADETAQDEAGPFLAMSRVVGLPDAGAVRFCVTEASCVDGRVRRDLGESGTTSAWIALDSTAANQIDTMDVRVLDGEGEEIAALHR